MKTAIAVGAVLLVGLVAGIRFERVPPELPPVRVVVKPCAAPKSLVERWEEEQTVYQQAAYAFKRPYREPPFQRLAFYAGSEAPENLIAERVSVGKLRWGPMAIETPYRVAWRGLNWITLAVPADATESQIADWKAEVERCEGASQGFDVAPIAAGR